MGEERFSIGPTATYRDRVVLWLAGAGVGDGVLVVTVYPGKGIPPPPEVYWVEWTDEGVVVWKASGGKRQRPYRVTAGRCTCDGMRPADRDGCKHLDAVHALSRRGFLKRPPPGSWDRPNSRQHTGEP